jgi:protein-tyrosine phosphatase
MSASTIAEVIDLHCHVLPGIDDGPPDMQASLELARALVADGTRIVVATPHLREDHPRSRADELADRCAELNQALDANGIDLRGVPGGEVDMIWARDASEENLRLASYCQRGTDVLLETPYGPLPPNFEEFVYNRLSSKGYRVMLGHPERNSTFQQHPERLAGLAQRGVLIQVTASSLTGRRRSETRRFARWLIEERLAHVIASDAHGAEHVRRPLLAAGVRAAAQIDPARARWMVEQAPGAVLSGKPLPPMPDRPRRRGLLRDVLRR